MTEGLGLRSPDTLLGVTVRLGLLLQGVTIGLGLLGAAPPSGGEEDLVLPEDNNTNNIFIFFIFIKSIQSKHKKSRIRETKHLSTDADSSTDTKNILLGRQNSPKKKLFFCVAILHPL